MRCPKCESEWEQLQDNIDDNLIIQAAIDRTRTGTLYIAPADDGDRLICPFCSTEIEEEAE